MILAHVVQVKNTSNATACWSKATSLRGRFLAVAIQGFKNWIATSQKALLAMTEQESRMCKHISA